MIGEFKRLWSTRWRTESAQKNRVSKFALACGALLLLCSSLSRAGSIDSGDPSPFVGRWQIDLSRTHMGRMGPSNKNLVRSSTFTFIFSPEGKNLRVAVYAEYPQAAPPRVATIIPDEKPHPCESKQGCLTIGGDPTQQTYEYFQISPHMLMRLFYVSGKIDEYTTYAVSDDGKTFTMIAWSPATPEYQNIQVFQRQL